MLLLRLWVCCCCKRVFPHSDLLFCAWSGALHPGLCDLPEEALSLHHGGPGPGERPAQKRPAPPGDAGDHAGMSAVLRGVRTSVCPLSVFLWSVCLRVRASFQSSSVFCSTLPFGAAFWLMEAPIVCTLHGAPRPICFVNLRLRFCSSLIGLVINFI